jgi:hypothetical protein
MAASSTSRQGAASPVPMRALLARQNVADEDARRKVGGIAPIIGVVRMSNELQSPLLLLLLLRSLSSLD